MSSRMILHYCPFKIWLAHCEGNRISLMNLFQVKSKKSSNETMEIKTNTPRTVVSS